MLVSCPRYWALQGHRLHERYISYLSLNQNSVCDVDCQGCFRYPSRKRGLPKESLLTMEDYERLITEFGAAGGLALEISGEGEPLMSHNTLPIIRLASQLGLWTTLITNGHLLTDDMLRELVELQVALVLSLHSLVEAVYERDSGSRGSFGRKMKNIDRAAEVFRGTGWLERGRDIRRAAIHWTLQSDNVGEVADARAFCDERGLLFSIAPLAKTGHAAARPDLWLPDEQRLKTVNALGDESIIFYDEPGGRVVCGTCKYGLNVGADGNLLLDAHGGYQVDISNIRTTSFAEAVRLQHAYSARMFAQLDGFCPVRDPGWLEFLAEQRYR